MNNFSAEKYILHSRELSRLDANMRTLVSSYEKDSYDQINFICEMCVNQFCS